jgi:large subunit ribosomal protein L35Ae
MKGTVLSFRRGLKVQKSRHFIIEVENIDKKEKAKPLIGKKVIWKSSTGKLLEGTITGLHGNKGHVKACFAQGQGLPGQAINDEVEVK